MITNAGFGTIPSLQDYLNALSLRCHEMYGSSLSKKQGIFLWVCMSCMVLYGQLMFSTISVQSFGMFSIATLSYMFRSSKFSYDHLIKAAVCLLFEIYRPQKAFLAIDDTDRARSKAVKAIGFVFKTLCKVTKGYILAQNIVFVCLVTDRFTIPIAFGFYVPDLAMKKWEKEEKRLKKKASLKKIVLLNQFAAWNIPAV